MLDQVLRMQDNGSATFLLQAGHRLLQVLELPIRTQIRLRNIMEMTFDGMERATQQERFEKLRGVYPKISEFCNARQARREYIAGKIKAEEFLRRIDTTHELTSYDTVKQELPPDESFWQKRVAADLDFDPKQNYPTSFMVLDLRKPTDSPQWQVLTKEELIQKDQEGHQSLLDQYKKNREPVSD